MYYIGILMFGGLTGSFLILYQNKCRFAVQVYDAKWGIRYNVLFAAVLAAINAMMLDRYGFSLEFMNYSAISLILVLASIEDINRRNIPDRLAVGALAVGLLLNFINLDIGLTIAAIGGAAAAGLVLWFTSLITKGGVGGGDIKLFACTGLFLGFSQIMSAMLLATLACGMVSVFAVLMGLSKLKGTIQFTPFILVGTVFTVLAG